MFQRLSDGLIRKSQGPESRWHFPSRELNVGPSECKAAVQPLGRCTRSTKCKIYLVSEWSWLAKIGKSVTYFLKLDFPMMYMGSEFAYISRKIFKSTWEHSLEKEGKCYYEKMHTNYDVMDSVLWPLDSPFLRPYDLHRSSSGMNAFHCYFPIFPHVRDSHKFSSVQFT